MKHLDMETICRLSGKIIQEQDFSAEDFQNLEHIRGCQDCYQELVCQLAIDQAMDNMGIILMDREMEEQPVPAAHKLSAVIHLLVEKASAVLQQLQETQWCFDQPLVPLGARGSDADSCRLEKLEDIDDSQTFVAYDPKRRLLVIQIDDCGETPQGTVILPDNSVQELTFQQQGDVYRAELSDLPVGDYQIELKR